MFAYQISASFLLILVVHFLFRHFKVRRKYRVIFDEIPGPKPLPFVGNALDFDQGYDGTLKTMQEEWPRQYGDIFHWFAGSQLNVSICSAELIEIVLTSQKILDKGTDYDWYRDWLGDGLLISTGEKWRRRRRLLTPAFHFQILDDFVHVFNKQGKVLVELMREKAGDELDVYPLLTNCTLDVICEAAMGVEVRAQLNASSQYAKDVARMTQIISERTTKPWLASDLLFPLTPTGQEQKLILSRIHSFTANIIQQRKLQKTQQSGTTNQDDNGNTLNTPEGKQGIKFECENVCLKVFFSGKKKSLLDLMLKAASDGNSSLTGEDLRHEIDTFAFGGHDTTSSALLWFLYCMASNPDCQEKAYQEIKDVVPDGNLDMEQLKQLKYLECCIKETLRLYPSAPLIERYCHEDFLLGNNVIPAGSNILMLIYALHRNEQYWSDPEKFDPDRFLDPDLKSHPFAYIPFSAGPRNCIGQRFALLEEKVIASWLLREFEFKLPDRNVKVVPSYQVVLKPLDGLKLIVQRR